MCSEVMYGYARSGWTYCTSRSRSIMDCDGHAAAPNDDRSARLAIADATFGQPRCSSGRTFQPAYVQQLLQCGADLARDGTAPLVPLANAIVAEVTLVPPQFTLRVG